MYERVPERIKTDGKLCLWRYELRDGKKTKVPYSISGKKADPGNADDFAPFGRITEAFAKGGHDGIGLMVEGPFSAIDVDDCTSDGKLTDMAQDIVEMMDSYTEISPSGKGIRIIFDSEGADYDSTRYYINNRNIHTEVYPAGCTIKYVTLTGNAVRDCGINPRGEQMLSVAEKYMVRPVKTKASMPPPGESALSDDEILQIAASAKNADKFNRLWDGDISGYLSQSEADIALLTILAFYCGGNTAQMDRMFRQSGLYREKWERDDYRNSTLRKAVSGCTDFYKPRTRSSAEEDFAETPFAEAPISLDGYQVPPFPVDALPKDIADYVTAVSESTQTPVDLPAVAALAVLSICLQGKYVIRPKPDWEENLNTFHGVFMPPSERKSAVCSAMARPMNEYEREWNTVHAAEIDFSRTEKSILDRRLKTLEDQASKGKAEMSEVQKAAGELTDFREKHPLRLYYDDITTEKLVSVIAENDGVAAIFSPEGGIFDLLKGMYTRYVNIDVFLKGYSGDPIRVDRIGRESETVYNPKLTVMLMAQPSVLEGVMENGNFRGRGLTARFLYCVPESKVGSRKYRSKPIPEETYLRYERCIQNLLRDDPDDKPEIITLTPEADELLEAFSDELEPLLKTEYADIADWAGKLVGNVARISGLLCRAETDVCRDFLAVPESLKVTGETMESAIRIGRYFIEHAKAAFSILGADESVRNCKYVLNAIVKNGLVECTRRDLMRLCRALKTTAKIQPVIDQLVDYGYLAEKTAGQSIGKGRSPAAEYLVNPCLYHTG